MHHNINLTRKNVKNEYSISTTNHESTTITSTNIGNKTGTNLEISATSPQVLKLNNIQFPASDGNDQEVLSTNGNGVLSFISTITGELINDTSPQLSADLDINSNNIGGNGNIDITGSIQCSSSLTCSNLNVNGTTTNINTTTLTIDDPLIYLAENNTGNTIDIGFYGKYVSSGTKYSGFARDATDGIWKLFETTTEPSTIIQNISLANLEINDLDCNSIASGTWAGNNLTKSQITNLTSDLTSINSSISTNTASASTNASNISTNTASASTNASNINLKAPINNPSFTGNVGINQTAPEEKLDVNGTIYARGGTAQGGGGVNNGTNTYMRFGEAGSSNDWCMLRQIGDNNNYHMTWDYHDDVGDCDVSWRNIKSSGAENPNIINTHMCIKGTGRVGIGTDNPACGLHLYTLSGNTRNEFRLQSTASNHRNVISFYRYDGTLNMSMGMRDDGGGFRFSETSTDPTGDSTPILNLDNGKVGIGDPNPSHKLDVNGDINFTGTLYQNGSAFGGGSSVWTESNSEAYYLGNVGIGTNNPASMLHIYENNTSVTSGLIIEQDGTGDAICQFLLTGARRWIVGADNSDADKFKISSTADLNSNNHFTIDTSGNVGIGDTTPSYKLDVTGDINFTGTLYQNGSAFGGGSSVWTEASNVASYGTGSNGTIKINSGDGDKIQLTNAGSNGSKIGHASGWKLQYKASSGTGSSASGIHSFYTTQSSAYQERMTIIANGNVGINTTNPLNRLDIVHDNNRSGTHRTGAGLYVTSSSSATSNGGIEVRHHNGTQGIGIGYAGIYATGSNSTQDLSIVARGSGKVKINSDLDCSGNAVIGSSGEELAIGYMGHNAWAGIAHEDNANSTEYALIQHSNGQTLLNCKSGQKIGFKEGNSEKMYLKGGDLHLLNNIEVEGDIEVEGVITGRAGIVQNVKFVIVDLGGSYDYQSNSWLEVFEYMYQPIKTPCRIIVQLEAPYFITGYGQDDFHSRLLIDEVQVSERFQCFTGGSSSGTRSGTLLPIMGSRELSSSTTTRPIAFEVKRDGANDAIRFYHSTTSFDLRMEMIITEISI